MDNLVQEIIICLYEWQPLTPQLEENLRDYLSKEKTIDSDLTSFQEDLLQKTLSSTLFRHFPPDKSKSAKLFKRIVLLLEELQAEVREEFYQAITSSKLYGALQFKSYFLQDGNHLLSLAERPELIVEGTTGLTTWTTAKSLAFWLKEHSEVLHGNILELGSGSGFTGIALAKMNSFQGKLFLTDHHRTVLEALRKNVAINLTETNGWSVSEDDPSVEKTYSKNGSSVVVRCLDWQAFDQHAAEDLDPDIIFGSDIVYDDLLLSPLADTIAYCLGLPGRQRVAYIAGVLRNEATSCEFVKQLRQRHLNVTIQTIEKSLPQVLLYVIKATE